ncbi:MAG: GatB/YqeY domain-containing protein [Bacteroidaceae bacterium]|nr:GatB/YqeY domain-containing protein [Bacteroidaceae bacterium]
MELSNRINTDIKEAMKSRDKVRLSTLRNIKKFFIEAKTAPGAAEELSEEAALKIVQKLHKQGKDAAEIYETQNRADLAEEEIAQVKILEEYLPKQLTDEQLTAVIRNIIEEVNATSLKEMGKVIGLASKKLAGQSEGRLISAKVKELLA